MVKDEDILKRNQAAGTNPAAISGLLGDDPNKNIGTSLDNFSFGDYSLGGGFANDVQTTIGAFMNNYDHNSYNDLRGAILAQKQGLGTVGTSGEMLAQIGNYNPTDNIDYGTVRGSTMGERAANTATATAQGFVSGMQKGGLIGGIVQGGVNLISGVSGSMIGNKKARQESQKLNNLATQQNTIGNATVDNNMMNLNSMKSNNRKSTLYAMGGPLETNGTVFDDGVNMYDAGGSHEENPNDGIQVGVAQDGLPELVEEGELRWQDYIFSKRLKAPKDIVKRMKGKEGSSYAELARLVVDRARQTPNDPIAKAGMERYLSDLRDSQEEKKIKKEQRVLEETLNSLSDNDKMALVDQLSNAMAEQDQQDAMQQQAMMQDPSIMQQQEAMAMADPMAQGIQYKCGGHLKSGEDGSSYMTPERLQVKPYMTPEWMLLKHGYRNGIEHIPSLESDITYLPSFEVTGSRNDAIERRLASEKMDAERQRVARERQLAVERMNDMNKIYSQDEAKARERRLAMQKRFEDDVTILPEIVVEGYGIPSDDYMYDFLSDDYMYDYTIDTQNTNTNTNMKVQTSAGNSVPVNSKRQVQGDSLVQRKTPVNLQAKYDLSRPIPQLPTQGIEPINLDNYPVARPNIVNQVPYRDSSLSPETAPNIIRDDKGNEGIRVSTNTNQPKVLNVPYKKETSIYRQAPIIANTGRVIADYFTRPDYTTPNMMADAAARIPVVNNQPFGTYMDYLPIDYMSSYNMLNNRNLAIDRNLRNMSNGNRAAMMAAAIQNGQAGQVAMNQQANTIASNNQSTRNALVSHNNSIEQANNKQAYQTQAANVARAKNIANIVAKEATMRNSIEAALGQAKSNNMDSLISSLSKLGKENEQKNWINALASSGYFGNLNYPMLKARGWKDKDIFTIMKNQNWTEQEMLKAGLTSDMIKKYTKEYEKKNNNTKEK